MKNQLEMLYGNNANDIEKKINDLIAEFTPLEVKNKFGNRPLSQKDSILITYGDTILDEQANPLKALKSFLNDYVGDCISAIHILPFYPYTSDDGFSVSDYTEVNPELGSWADIHLLNEDYELMFDAVINHSSSANKWFEAFRCGNPAYENYYISADPKQDYSMVVRPRALPLLTAFEINGEKKYIWTTFSEDQVDLNYKNPKVLIEILRVLLIYIRHGARFIRLDAIGFAWKKEDSTCIHLPEVHGLVQIIRAVLERAKEDVVIITETNVPHKENISYFGKAQNEAHMVYQFPLPPLTLLTMITGNASKLLDWLKNMEIPDESSCFFNFLASHDGIGVRPVEGLISQQELQFLLTATETNHGRIAYKNNGDGTKSPYELNINYLDVLRTPNLEDEMLYKKFIATQAILLSLKGVPGLYIHSLLGSVNDLNGMEKTQISRRINREKLDTGQLREELENIPRRSVIFNAIKALLEIRGNEKAFSPFARQNILSLDSRIFSIERISQDQPETITVLINISDQSVFVEGSFCGKDLITNQVIENSWSLMPYEVLWIKQVK